jgi:hypothetical protein
MTGFLNVAFVSDGKAVVQVRIITVLENCGSYVQKAVGVTFISVVRLSSNI